PLIVTLAGMSAVASPSYHMPLALVQAAREFKTVAIATIAGGLVGLAAVVVLLLVSTVAWSLAGIVAGEGVCLVYLWVGRAPSWGAAAGDAMPRPQRLMSGGHRKPPCPAIILERRARRHPLRYPFASR